MPVFTTLMVIILLASVALCWLVLSRVFAYNRKHHFPESVYTKLFGIFTKEHIAIIYATTVALYLIFTIWFVWTL